MQKLEKVIYQEALQKAEEVAKATIPEPMIVGTAKTFLGNEIDETKKTYFVEGGVCGFAWIVVKPALGKFVKWLKLNQIGYKNYGGGWAIPARPEFTKNNPLAQSLAINEAWARAFAQVLRDNGLDAYAESRMD